MAGKLIIRRVGHLLPTVCLVALLLIVGVITWLSTVGLPGCALRYMEQQAGAAAGLPISIEKIKLAPRSGLAVKAEGVRLELPQPDALPLSVEIRKAQVEFSLSRMLRGQFEPEHLHVLNLRAQLPLSNIEDDSINLAPLNLHAYWSKSGKGIAADIRASLQGINLQGKLALSDVGALLSSLDNGESETSEPAESLGELVAGYRPALRTFKEQIDRQQWEHVPPPNLSISAAHRKDWVVDISAQVPSYIQGHFHFLDSQLDAKYARNTFVINTLSFRTENPDTTVKLQASYDMEHRELAFATRSTAPVVRIANDYLGPDTPPMLAKIQADEANTPTIELNGTAAFSESYALNSITLRGKLEQKGFRIGTVPADYLLLTFFMRDGSFNLDQCLVNFPEGRIVCAAQQNDGIGRAELDLALPDETLLQLAREFSDNPEIALPEWLNFKEKLEVHLSADLNTPPFEPGQSHIEDLIPTLRSCQLQFRTPSIVLHGTEIQSPELHVDLSGIDYSSGLNISEACIKARVATTRQSDDTLVAAENLQLNLKLNQLSTDADYTAIRLGHSSLNVQAESVSLNEGALKGLHAEAFVDELQVNLDDVMGSLSSSALAAEINLETLSYTDTTAEGLQLQVNIPSGLIISDTWRNMQRDTKALVTLQRLTGRNNFCATDTRLDLHNTGANTMQLQLTSQLGNEQAQLYTNATLTSDELLRLSGIRLHLPAASLLPLLGGEPLAELRLPRMLELQGDALLNPATGQLLSCHYYLQLPELVRVCNNVYVHKGMEIPLKLDVNGNFSTAPDGTMHYEADVEATHAEGRLAVHVSGDPLRDCHITGSNTIPVSIVNALIDNADAHWIMRDFRCTPGVTRNVITGINTTIRYQEGVYVHALCKANLYDMDFLLGAIRDKEDAQGNPTGEEYLRTDLGKDPYSRVKEGHCDVEVLVQLDCKDAEGKPLKDEILINLLNPDLLYDNRPWLRRMNIKSGVTTSRITGEAVRFDIEACTISLHKLKGSCYPAYSIGMYYAPLQHFLEDIVLDQPADIETEYCIFPISGSCQVPMQGLIRAEAARGAGFRFLGTIIPLRNFSGFINISDEDVYLDRLNAQSWGGVVNGLLRIGFAGEHTTLDGYFGARNLNLKDIVASYGEEFTSATCNGYIRFQAPRPELEAVKAYGEVHLQDGDLMEIGLFRPIGALISDMPNQLRKLQDSIPGANKIQTPGWSGNFVDFVWDTSGEAIDTVGRTALRLPFANHFLRYGIDEAHSRFDITNGHLITRGMKAKGYNLNVQVQLDINLDTLTFRGDLWPRISSVPTVLISPVTILSDFLIDVNLHGDILNPQWEFGLSKKLRNEPASLSSEPQEESTPAN